MAQKRFQIVDKNAVIFRDTQTGELVVRRRKRRDQFRGDDMEGLDGLDGLDGDDDDFGDDDFGDDDFGASGRRAARVARRLDNRLNRLENRLQNIAPTYNRSATEHTVLNGPSHTGRPGQDATGVSWARTLVSGTTTLGAAGPSSVQIRLQHDFKAEDVTFNGSLAGSLIFSIFFADQLIWSNPDGVDVSTFAVTGFFRGLLAGQFGMRGTDIIVNCSLPGAGSVKCAITGFKPANIYNCPNPGAPS